MLDDFSEGVKGTAKVIAILLVGVGIVFLYALMWLWVIRYSPPGVYSTWLNIHAAFIGEGMEDLWLLIGACGVSGLIVATLAYLFDGRRVTSVHLWGICIFLTVLGTLGYIATVYYNMPLGPHMELVLP